MTEGARPSASPWKWLEAERPRLRSLAKLPRPVPQELGLHAETHACAACRAARAVRQVAEEEHLPLSWDEVAPVLPGHEGIAAPPPWLRVLLPGSDVGPVRFLGPLRGDLLEGWARVLEDVSPTTPPDLTAWKEVLPRLRRRHHFRLFAAARCADAPPVVRALARVVHSAPDRLALDVIDVECFPALSRRYGVRTLPTVTLDDFGHFYAPPEEEELARTFEEILPSGGFAFPGARGDSPFGNF